MAVVSRMVMASSSFLGYRPLKVARPRAIGNPETLSERVGEFLEVAHDEVGLVGPVAEGPLATVDESATHAGGFRAHAVEGVVRDEQDLLRPRLRELGALAIGGRVGLEAAGLGDRDDAIER